MARLLWLVLSAAGDKDVGPDIALAHAVGTRLEGDVLKAALAGKTLSVAQSFAGGPYAWQLHADGKFSFLARAERRELSSGKWRIDDRGRYCRTLNEPRPREFCFAVVENQGRLLFFDADDLMRFDTVAE